MPINFDTIITGTLFAVEGTCFRYVFPQNEEPAVPMVFYEQLYQTPEIILIERSGLNLFIYTKNGVVNSTITNAINAALFASGGLVVCN